MKKLTKKTVKSLILGTFLAVFLTGTVYAAWLVWRSKTKTKVQEPISVAWDREIPEETYPNQTYDFAFCVKNTDAEGNGEQKVGVKVNHSKRFVGKELVATEGSIEWGVLRKLTMKEGTKFCVKGLVYTPSDIKPTVGWVEVSVSRE